MNIDFTPAAWDEYVDWLQHVIKDIMRDPFDGLGKPESLRENLLGYWSRRIDDKHRLVYQIHEERCLIVQCRVGTGQGFHSDEARNADAFLRRRSADNAHIIITHECAPDGEHRVEMAAERRTDQSVGGSC